MGNLKLLLSIFLHLVFVSLLSSCGTGVVVLIKKNLGFKVESVQENPQKEKLKQKLYLELPELQSAENNLEKARILRNFVHQNTKIGLSPYDLPLDPKTLEQWKNGEIKLVCSGMTSFYGSMLSAFEIPFRLVDTFLENDPDPKYDGHSFLEVKIEEAWVIQDPTFNIEWIYNGKLLNTRELRVLIKEKDINPLLLAQTNSNPVILKRSLKAYHHKMEDLLNFVEIRDYLFFDKSGPGITLVDLFPHQFSRKYDRLKDKVVKAPESMVFSEAVDLPKTYNRYRRNAKKIDPTPQGIKVETSEISYDMQFQVELLLTKPVKSCKIRIDFDVQEGGINFGFVANNKVLGSYKFWQNQFKNCKLDCHTYFEASDTEPFRTLKITYLNWNENLNKKSIWNLRQIHYSCF